MALGFMYRLEHADGTPADPPWSAIEQLLDHDRVRAVPVWARAAPDRDVVGPQVHPCVEIAPAVMGNVPAWKGLESNALPPAGRRHGVD